MDKQECLCPQTITTAVAPLAPAVSAALPPRVDSARTIALLLQALQHPDDCAHRTLISHEPRAHPDAQVQQLRNQIRRDAHAAARRPRGALTVYLAIQCVTLFKSVVSLGVVLALFWLLLCEMRSVRQADEGS